MRYIITAIIGYLIGNISSSYIVGKISSNIDVRQHGSGNLGATNTFRVLGFKAGIIVFAGDLLKGVVATLIGLWIAGGLGGMVGGMAAVIGHNWPAFLGFKGGKGIATSLGLIFTISPWIGVILFLFGASIIALTRYVSLASILSCVLFPILLVFFHYDLSYIIGGILLSILAIYRHKANIFRLVKGNENKIKLISKTR